MKAYIKHISSYLPDNIVSNDLLVKIYPDWNAEKISSKTGIYNRHIAGSEQTATDMAYEAANNLLNIYKIDRSTIDFVILCTQSPDYFLPSSSCILQDRLELSTSCGAFDFNLGCSGFVYGLSIAKGLIETGSAKNILLITAETYSKYLHEDDRSVRTIFGDGAAATLISSKDSTRDLIGPFIFGTDGSGANNLIVETGASKIKTLQNSEKDFLQMDGPAIFNFTLKNIPKLIKQIMDKAHMTMDEVDYFVYHQANSYMLEALRKKSKIPKEKFCINMQDYGNTVSATIPMALEIAMEQKEIKTNDKIVLAGFGVGLSWAATVIEI